MQSTLNSGPKLQPAFYIGHEQPATLIVAEASYGGGGSWVNGVTPATGPACFLKREYLVSYGAGLGIYGKHLFYSTADNTG